MIDKVGGLIIFEKKLLVQRKNNNREECIMPGGKRENNESDFETLKRELKEELNIDLISCSYLGSFDDIAVFSDKPIHVEAYIVDSYSGNIKCMNEIKEAIWIDKDYKSKGIILGSILEKCIPILVEKGLM